MRKYEVDLIIDGVTSPIDIIIESDDYTAEDYINDCDENADADYCKDLHKGIVKLVVITDLPDIGATYTDEDGTWEVVEIEGDIVTVRNLNDNDETWITVEEALNLVNAGPGTVMAAMKILANKVGVEVSKLHYDDLEAFGTDGHTYLWYVDNDQNAAVEMKTGRVVTDSDELHELFD